MIRVIKYIIIAIFVTCIIFSMLIMVDNYESAVVKGISQTIVCDNVESEFQDTKVTRTVETCFTYNPQLLFYGQFIIIAVLAVSFKYVYNLSVAYIKRTRKLSATPIRTNLDDE